MNVNLNYYTREEVQSALHLCAKRRIKKLVLISSPTHIARCLQEACKQKATGPYSDIIVYGRASDVCFAGSTPEDVLIIEPPHRMDRPNREINKIMKNIFLRLQDQDNSDQLYSELSQIMYP